MRKEPLNISVGIKCNTLYTCIGGLVFDYRTCCRSSYSNIVCDTGQRYFKIQFGYIVASEEVSLWKWLYTGSLWSN